MNRYKIIVLPDNVEIMANEGTSLKKAFEENGLDFEFPCGGMGACKKCKVKIVKGTGQEEILACQLKVNEDLTVEIPDMAHRHDILVEGIQRKVVLNPLIKKVYFEAPRPSLDDNRDDFERITEGKGFVANLRMLQDLPEKLRKNDFKATAVIAGNEIIGAESGNTGDRLLGMAFDIGTTTIAGYLLNLKTGQEITRVSALNPQIKYGADVITRIIFAAESAGGLEKLHKELIDELNGLVEEAVDTGGFGRTDVYALTVAGNTAMHHLFFGIQPRYLAGAPYVPAVTRPVTADACDIGVKINPAGKIYAFPNIAGFVGGDTVASALISEMDKADKLKLLIDIGTNGEIVLGTKTRLLACSVAAGPAFEGVQISCGMRGASGAIDHVSMGEEYKYSVIGDVPPRGIAGSGLVDAAAGLLETGVIDKAGRVLKPEEVKNEQGRKYRDRIIEISGILSFLLAENTGTGKAIYISQKDIRQFQLAKGAVAAGIEILLKIYGAETDDIDEVLLAGAFGNYLNPSSACRTGLIPQELEGKTTGIGNAAGGGAKLALLSENEYERAAMLSKKIQYIELSARPEFNSTFLKKLGFDNPF